MPSKILALPFAIATLIVFYLMMEGTQIPGLIFVLMFLMMILAAILILSPQIDWWYYRRNPKRLSSGIKSFLLSHIGFYKQLEPKAKKRFEQRLSLSLLAYDFKPLGFETMPEDVKAIILCNAVRLTFGLPDYLIRKFENIVVYPHPFPSPQFPENLHASELFEEDGVLVFSAEQIMQHVFNPDKVFNIVLYEWVRAHFIQNPSFGTIQVSDEEWLILDVISGIPRNRVIDTIGLAEKDVDRLAATVVDFFHHPERFSQALPRLFDKLADRYNVQPQQYRDPIFNKISAGKDF